MEGRAAAGPPQAGGGRQRAGGSRFGALSHHALRYGTPPQRAHPHEGAAGAPQTSGAPLLQQGGALERGAAAEGGLHGCGCAGPAVGPCKRRWRRELVEPRGSVGSLRRTALLTNPWVVTRPKFTPSRGFQFGSSRMSVSWRCMGPVGAPWQPDRGVQGMILACSSWWRRQMACPVNPDLRPPPPPPACLPLHALEQPLSLIQRHRSFTSHNSRHTAQQLDNGSSITRCRARAAAAPRRTAAASIAAGTLLLLCTASRAAATPCARAVSAARPCASPNKQPATRQSPAPLQLTTAAGSAGR